VSECRICNGTGVVSDGVSLMGEPPDYWPIDCPQCNGGETTVDDLRVGHDWRAEPPVYARRDGAKVTVTLQVTVNAYDAGEGWDVAEAVKDRVREVLARNAGSYAIYGAEVEISTWEE
jgi:hypothetical protein